MDSDLTIRGATRSDIPAITRIYNQGIRDRVATLETDERTESERLGWLQSRSERTPVLVADSSGQVRGWGSLNQFNPRTAYRYVADFSIYVDRDCRGNGVGTRLLEALIDAAKALGYHKLVLAAFPWNQAGMKLYQRAGFREVGRYEQQGVLDNAWVDTVVMELLLDNQPPPTD